MGVRIPLPTEAQVQRLALKNARSLLGPENVRRRNTGGMYNARGRFVRFGDPGDSDIAGMIPAGWGDASGRAVAIECKRGGWRPPGPAKPGAKRGAARLHWEAQAAKLRAVNAAGGYGWWVDDGNQVVDVLLKIKQGWRVELGERDEVVLIVPKGGVA